MRKILAAWVVGAVVASASCFGGTVNIFNYDLYVYTSDSYPGGVIYIPDENNWVIAVYGAGGDGVVNLFGQGDDDLLFTFQGGTWYGDGLFSGNFSSSGSTGCFGRIYNSSDFVSDTDWGSATEYVNLSYGVTNLPPLGTTQSINWDPGGTSDDGSDWQPIPEPGTLALFGLGLLMLSVGRRFRRR